MTKLTQLSCACAIVFLAGLPVYSADRTAHVDAAEVLVKSLDADHNEYAYKDLFIKWKGENGATEFEARCDCSGFVTLLFEHVYGFAPKQMEKWMGKSRPLARDYHDQIEAENGFKQIKKLADVQRGDLIAVKYIDDSKKDTGHVMLVQNKPRSRETTAPSEPGTRQWEVDVIDSSKSGHGPTDTRRKPDKTYSTGVGRGTLRLYTNADGEVVGYSWSTLAKSEFYPPEKHHVVIGRLLPDFTP